MLVEGKGDMEMLVEENGDDYQFQLLSRWRKETEAVYDVTYNALYLPIDLYKEHDGS